MLTVWESRGLWLLSCKKGRILCNLFCFEKDNICGSLSESDGYLDLYIRNSGFFVHNNNLNSYM